MRASGAGVLSSPPTLLGWDDVMPLQRYSSPAPPSVTARVVGSADFGRLAPNLGPRGLFSSLRAGNLFDSLRYADWRGPMCRAGG